MDKLLSTPICFVERLVPLGGQSLPAAVKHQGNYRTYIVPLGEGLPATADIREPSVWLDGDQEAGIWSIMLSLIQAVPVPYMPHSQMQ